MFLVVIVCQLVAYFTGSQLRLHCLPSVHVGMSGFVSFSTASEQYQYKMLSYYRETALQRAL